MSLSAERGASPALALDRIAKRFGSTLAVDGASFSVNAGSVHALLGENGAGKSTLMRVAFGMHRPDAGTIRIAGQPTALGSAADAIARGVGMVHQHFTNVPAMTVAENVALGHHGRFSAKDAAARVAALGERTGLRLDPNARVADLPVGAQQRLEIVKALGQSARILILDEPTAVLAPSEADDLLAWLRRFADDGNAVVLITHKLREALAIADDVTVMRRGRVTFAGRAADSTAASLAAAIVGETLPAPARSAAAPTGTVVARAQHVTVDDTRGAPVLRDASVDVRSGEILGVVAVEGSGQHELLRALARRLRPSRGSVETAARIAFIPEDRHADALVLELSQTENVLLKGAGRRRGRVDWQSARALTERAIAEHDVRGGDPDAPSAALSGGNQQKLVLARELADNPELVVAENPTRGLDIRATSAVHDRLRAAAAEGAAVVVYSSDLDEVLSLATRVVVLHAGVVREAASLDRETIGREMLGLAS